MLGFRSVAQFDLAFGIMVVGMLLTLPVNIAAALYRARGLYGRAVKLVNLGMMGALFGQLAAVTLTQSLLYVTIVYVAAQMLAAAYLLMIDAPAAVSVFARNAPDAVVALDCWPVSQGRAVCGGGRHRSGVVQSAGAAGQRVCARSRRGGAMGPHPRRRRTGAGALRPDDPSSGCRARPRLCGRATSNGCEASTPAARCW